MITASKLRKLTLSTSKQDQVLAYTYSKMLIAAFRGECMLELQKIPSVEESCYEYVRDKLIDDDFTVINDNFEMLIMWD